MNSWENWEFDTEINRLEQLIKFIGKNSENIPFELVSLSCERVCISISASLGKGIQKILWDYANFYEGGRENFCLKLTEYRLKKLRNPTVEEIKNLLRDFDPNFKTGLTTDSPLEVLVKKRNSIAHTINQHNQITLSDLNNYLEEWKSFLQKLHEHFERTQQ